jgi:hypothetical protein
MAESSVEAKKELTLQLIDLLTPHLYDGIKSIFDTCKKEKQVLKTFQNKLCSIHLWNQLIIDKEFDRIIKKKDVQHLDKLLDMLFVSHVKVLSALKINNNNKVNIEVPNQKVFIHKCYIQCARAFYCDPYLIDDREINFNYSEIQRNIKRSHTVINNCIEKTVRDLIPLKEILDAYSKSLEEAPEEEINQQVEEELNDLNEIDGPEEFNNNQQDQEEDEQHDQEDLQHDQEDGQEDQQEDQQESNENFEHEDELVDSTFMNEPKNDFRVPDLNVTSGEEIRETPPIQNYIGNEINLNGETYVDNVIQDTCESPNEIYTNNGFKANVSTDTNGFKNILIQRGPQTNSQQQQESPKQYANENQSNFFSDEDEE